MIFSKKHEKSIMISTKILSTPVFNIDNVSWAAIIILEWFLKDHVTLDKGIAIPVTE